ncbi:MAG: NAD(P)/FAD-dependent oxidoreductase [Alphaproteobacteria bacterium]|nr:MAG: NAD(P)/FAD-dependent oxidoreductase [Alphaproteobacteria bacterium]
MNMNTPISGPEHAWAKEGRQPRIAIIGAGFSGMGSIIKLREAGYTDITCFEREDKLGGTWRDNTYPGLSCDVPSHWYSYSFELNPDWSYRFSYGPEIWAYQEKIARKYDLLPTIQFNNAVKKLTYLGSQWKVETEKNGEEIFDFVIAATGVLVNPAYPDIPGLDSFKGHMFHSARWNHDVSIKGKRVGIIGTGSTACQIVGAIAEEVGHLDVFQRTPHWVVPMPQKKYTKAWQTLLRIFPPLQMYIRNLIRRRMEGTFGKATLGDEAEQERIQQACLQFLKEQVPDPELREKLTPNYKATCKRLILCSDFYPALQRDNVELVTENIEAIEPEGVRTKDGQLHELDVLVLATGFRAGDFILPTEVIGENGLSLRDFWHGLPRAHRGMTFPGFPNFWMLEGPTGVIGNTCLIDISEHQIGYMIDAINKIRDDKLVAIAPKMEAFEGYNARIADAIKTSTWASGGCSSWYLDPSGTPNIYPWLPDAYREDMKNIDFTEYELVS